MAPAVELVEAAYLLYSETVVVGDVVLWAQLRTSDKGGADGVVPALTQVVAALRQRCRKARIVVRGDIAEHVQPPDVSAGIDRALTDLRAALPERSFPAAGPARNGGPVNKDQCVPARNFSASSAAMQPMPALVTA